MNNKKTKRNRNFHHPPPIISDSLVKVGWEELLYDLIFIIVISKISELIVQVPLSEINIGFLISEIMLFFTIIIMWFNKVMSSNRLHVLEQKLKIKIPKHKFITYIQLTIFIILFSQLETTIKISYYAYLLIFGVTFSILSTIAIKNFLLNYYLENKSDFTQVFKLFKNNHNLEINLPHFLERLGVLMILFIGELLNCIFNLDQNFIVLLFSIVIILNTFSANVRILEVVEEEKTKNSNNLKKVISYFIKNFIIYLAFIILFDYTAFYNIELPAIFILLILIDKLRQRIMLWRLKDIWFNKIEILALLYFTLLVIIIYYFKIFTIYTLILVILVGVSEKLRNEYYKEKKKIIEGEK